MGEQRVRIENIHLVKFITCCLQRKTKNYDGHFKKKAYDYSKQIFKGLKIFKIF